MRDGDGGRWSAASELAGVAGIADGYHLPWSGELSPESARANEAFLEYLRGNVQASAVLNRLQDRIRVFLDVAPRVFITKCIDGRVHTNDEIGYPPATIKSVRAEGTIVDLTANNTLLWNRLNSVILAARRHTPDCPALFLAMAHRGELGSGCAAHGQDDENALRTVRDQADELRRQFRPEELYIVHGISNTDDHSNRLIFADGHELDAARIIRHLDTGDSPLRRPADAFQAEFLDRLIDDRRTDVLVGRRAPRVIMDGAAAPMYHDLQVMIAMEAYLIGEMTRILGNRSRNNVVFQPRLLDYVVEAVDAVEGLPRSLVPALVYQVIWNITYALHHRRRLDAIRDELQSRLELDHAENMVAYGEGFEVEPRNLLVLVKPGRGKDLEALAVARRVITKHRHNRGPQDHPPLVHINAEIAGSMDSWLAFNDNVLARLLTMIANVHAVFGDDCRVLTTYSYREEKRFYPVRVDPATAAGGGDPRDCFPGDVGAGFFEDTFSNNELRLREDAYTRSLLGRA